MAVLTEDIVLIAGRSDRRPVGLHPPAPGGRLPRVCRLALARRSWPVARRRPGVGVGAFLYLSGQAMTHLQAAREGQDGLVSLFRALTEGFRELKLHRPRREAFQAEALGPASVLVRDESSRGLTLYAVAEGWGQLALFGFLGLARLRLARPAGAGPHRPWRRPSSWSCTS